MSSPITQMELAMLAQLRAATRAYAKPVIESYAGQLDDALFGWVRTLPAVWVTFNQVTEVKRQGAHSFLMSGSFEVLSAQRALQENAGRLAGSDKGAGVGVYELLEDNKLALVNQTLGLAIQPFTPGAIRPVMKNMVDRDAVVVYAQEFHTRWVEFFEDAPLTPAGELQMVGFSYYLKPQHTPSGDPADKTDQITIL